MIPIRVSAALLLCSSAAALNAGAAPKRALRGLFERAVADDVLACPIDKEPLRAEVSVVGGLSRERRVSSAGVRYPVNQLYADLLPTAGRATATLGLDELRDELTDAWSNRVQTSLFRSPLTAFLYERGWRDNFKNAGFPGIDVEFEEVSKFFEPAIGGTVVDMSCGSGLMTRRLVKSGSYGRVLALDYSEAMLTETARRVREEGVPTSALTLCRADVANLPLRPASVDAMHAGAAMHCWPRLEEGLQQIRQSLKPGGRFFATTFLQGAYGAGTPPNGGGFRFFVDEAELEQLLIVAGFEASGVEVRREGRGCAIIKAVVPALEPATEEVLPMEAKEDLDEDVESDVDAEANDDNADVGSFVEKLDI